MTDTTNTRRTYVSIQILRALSSSLVVLFHLIPFESKFLQGQSIVPKIFGLGEIGVDLFFLISGFIITLSTHGRFGYWRQAVIFCWNRFTRIFPLYWVYCLILVLVYLVKPDIFSGLRGRPDILSSFLLLPGNGAPLLLVAWSLTFEVQFYLAFAIAILFLPERGLMAACSVWALIIVARNLFIKSSLGSYGLLFDLFNLEFLIGCLLARAVWRINNLQAFLSFCVGLIVIAIGYLIFRQPDGKIHAAWARTLLGGGGLALILMSAVVFESYIRRVTPRFIVAIGDASYSIYLSHLVTLQIVGAFWRFYSPRSEPIVHVVALASAFAAALVAGWLSFRWIEQPLLFISRRLTHSLRRFNRNDIVGSSAS